MKKIYLILTMLLISISVISQTTINKKELPNQTGHAGQYLKTNGTQPSWATVTAGLSGSLTANYIPYAVGSTSLTNSTIKYTLAGHLDFGMNGLAISTYGLFPIYGGFGNSFETGYIGVLNDISLNGSLKLASSGYTKIGTNGYDAITYYGANGHFFSGGRVGIGTASPTSILQVIGLLEYADNATAITAGLTVGAFYRTGDLLKVVH